MREVVLHHATGQLVVRARARWRCGSRHKSIGIAAETTSVDALELDAEVGGAAVILRIEAVRLAAGCGADLDHLDSHALQAVHDRLAGGTSA